MIWICCYCQSCCVCEKPLLFLLKCSGNLCFAGGLIWTKMPQFHSCPYPKCHGDLPRRWREKGIGGMVKRAFSFLCLAHPCKGLSRTTAYNSRHEMVLLPLEITLVDLGKGAGPTIHSYSWVNCSGVTWPQPTSSNIYGRHASVYMGHSHLMVRHLTSTPWAASPSHIWM